MSGLGHFAKKVFGVLKKHGGAAIPTSQGGFDRLKPAWDYIKRKVGGCVKWQVSPEQEEDEASAKEGEKPDGLSSPTDFV